MPDIRSRKYRSSAWFEKLDKDGFIHRSWVGRGLPPGIFDGRPIVGICNTWSELTPCNAHFRELAEHVKRGVWEAGGLPMEFPVTSLGETSLRPTAMLFRNLASMDVEESIRGNPIDGVVLLCGCDKTTPSLVMGAASCDVPALVVSGGPMLNGKFRGEDLGSGTDVWRFSEDVKAGRMSQQGFMDAESCMSRSSGTCNVMGTASTMASMVEALGLSLPDNAAIPAVDSRRYAQAHLAGRRIVDMIATDLRLSKILTREAFENAIRVNGAVGGSTNAVIHLLAIAGRIGVTMTLDDWDRCGRDVPTVVDLKPSGRFLMEDFYYAGGVPAVARALGEIGLLHRDALTVNGRTIWENCKDAPNWNPEVIRPVDRALTAHGGIAVVRGNLAPSGAVVKPSAASPHLMKHRGPAIVFENIEHYRERIIDPALEVTKDSVLVLKNCGPKGYPGMAEVGNMGLPPKILQQGITDMVRVSDARMSGTAYGTVVLHVAPEAAIGGPLALVRDGDPIELDVAARRLELLVDAAELDRRRAAWRPPAPVVPPGGYAALHLAHVQQADTGADLDFLVGCRGHLVGRESH
ncbi:MAG: dihydroxy-acid dehydratase [Acidobacteria bacterium]|nr:dihydroxy-acid dehydratase [Acidobacteriota bacterium]